MDSMTSMTTTASSAISTGTSTGMSGMGGMDMAPSCKISMLWNWNTIDACFLSSSWHIHSRGMFAGSCIAVICLVLILEFLRRVGREYDAFIVRRAQLRKLYLSGSSGPSTGPVREESSSPKSKVKQLSYGHDVNSSSSSSAVKGDVITAVPVPATAQSLDRAAPSVCPPCTISSVNGADHAVAAGCVALSSFRPSPVEQMVRALLHMLQFAVAYFIMLLAMYFNGYIIICIFIGAFLGSLIFSWEPVSLNRENDATQVTKCCG